MKANRNTLEKDLRNTYGIFQKNNDKNVNLQFKNSLTITDGSGRLITGLTKLPYSQEPLVMTVIPGSTEIKLYAVHNFDDYTLRMMLHEALKTLSKG